MDYKDTLRMPKTDFEMRGNLTIKEPIMLKKWQEDDFYNKVIAKNKDLYDSHGVIDATNLTDEEIDFIEKTIKPMKDYGRDEI